MLNNKIKRATFYIGLAVALADLALWALNINGYKINFLKSSGLIYPLSFNILLLVVLCVLWIKSRLYFLSTMAMGLSLFLSICLAGALFIHLAADAAISTVTSPGHTTIYVEHRTTTLGETNYLYTIYLKEPYLWGAFIKEIKAFSFFLPYQDDLPSSEEALGLHNPVWPNDTSVRFHTIQGDVSIDLK
ncbi:hypothetical protein [Paenibacillus protaetiae]|uniref:Uncharacterized protein n=1 Tax=Paenibacillus protaetiae TaxID=2509456 RepID=A0A4P6ESD9_9BACL|nr:hypothetical protein [Paenibacillus protaetiae]QAY65345.1 hypothetical protein ET464_02080 [Paenibacillus protaetiae]